MRTFGFGKIFVLVVAITAIAGLAIAADRAGDRDRGRDEVAVERSRYMKAINQLIKDIGELDDRNENNPKKEDRKWIRERLEAMRADLVGVRADLEAAPPAGHHGPGPGPWVPPPPPTPIIPLPPPEPQPMNGQQFSEFLGELKKQSFDKERLFLLKEVSSEAWFTTDQVIQAMSLFSFSSEKIAAGTAMYPHVVDRTNWFKVYSTFTFSSDQEKLRKQTSGK